MSFLSILENSVKMNKYSDIYSFNQMRFVIFPGDINNIEYNIHIYESGVNIIHVDNGVEKEMVNFSFMDESSSYMNYRNTAKPWSNKNVALQYDINNDCYLFDDKTKKMITRFPQPLSYIANELCNELENNLKKLKNIIRVIYLDKQMSNYEGIFNCDDEEIKLLIEVLSM